MLRTLLAALASLAVLAAQPALACDDCKDCPMHKKAAAAKADGKEAKAGCPCCAAAGKECKHGPDAPCPHCDAKKAAEKKTTETKG